MKKTLRQLRRVFIAIVGFTVLLIGVVMFVTPGPATLVIPLGLGILATEFVWAKRLVDRAKAKLSRRKEGRSDGAEAEREGRGVLREVGVREKEEVRGGKAQEAC